jgi:predicted Zn-dependent protease
MTNFLFDLIHRFRRRWMYSCVSLLVAFGLVLTMPHPAPAIPWLELLIRGVQVIQLSNVSDEAEVQLGGQINQQLLRQEFRLYDDDRSINDYVKAIGQRLVPHSDRPDIPYVFQVVDDDQVNAFATMGGYVYVTTGLIKTATNEAELASVLGHEIGHIAAHHALEQMRDAALTQGLASAAGLDRNAAVNIGVELALRRPHSRQDELEADQLGLANLVGAGYAPSAMVTFMEKLLGQRSIPTFLSTHPATSTRIEELNEQIDPATANVGAGLDSASYRATIRSLLN